MFEGIFYRGHAEGITSVSFLAGEVIGHVSFSAQPDRTCIISSVGPDSAVRECVASHYYSSWEGRYKARTDEEVSDYT